MIDLAAVIIQQPDTGGNSGGFIAFAIIAALFIAGAFLYRSLRHQLRKIDFEEPEPPSSDGDAAGSSSRP